MLLRKRVNGDFMSNIPERFRIKDWCEFNKRIEGKSPEEVMEVYREVNKELNKE